MRDLNKLVLIAIGLISFTACTKDKKIEPIQPAVTTATVAFDFTATANNRFLVADTAWYSNAAGDSFTVSKFNYYISNIKFIRNDGFVFAEPESYRINRHVGGPTSFTVSNVPEGIYTGIDFLIGVDSLRNASGAQTGALDVYQGMYWDWMAGYIFFKLEGNFKSPGFPQSTEYGMHIGTTPNLEKCSFDLGANILNARQNKQSLVHFNVNIDEIFMHPVNLDMNTYHAVTGGKPAGNIANNYKDMFRVTGVEN